MRAPYISFAKRLGQGVGGVCWGGGGRVRWGSPHRGQQHPGGDCFYSSVAVGDVDRASLKSRLPTVGQGGLELLELLLAAE